MELEHDDDMATACTKRKTVPWYCHWIVGIKSVIKL